MQATTVAAQGEAKSDYNLAGFTVSLETLRPAVPTAKILLKKKVDGLLAALDAMKQKLGLEFVKNSIRSSSNVQEHHEYEGNKHVLKGYKATYNYSFQIDDLDKVSQVYDVLTSLEEVRASSPSYALKNRDKLNKKALKHAFEKVKERFETECNVLGLNPADFEIASWEATYNDSQRSDRVAASTRRAAGGGAPRRGGDDYEGAIACAAPVGAVASAEDEPLELVVGQAVVTANLEVGYARKSEPTTYKAQVVRPSNGVSTQEEKHV